MVILVGLWSLVAMAAGIIIVVLGAPSLMGFVLWLGLNALFAWWVPRQYVSLFSLIRAMGEGARTPDEIAEAAAYRPGSIRQGLVHLEDDGIIEESRFGQVMAYRLTEMGERVYRGLLVMEDGAE